MEAMLKSVVIAIAVDTSEMRFLEEKKTSICIRLYKTENCCLRDKD